MTIDEFRNSLSQDEAPNLSPILRALWFDAAAQWDKAHQIVQNIDTREGSRVHAYLHRKEGDMFNADYWYHRAGITMPQISLEEEWELLSREFL